MMKHSNTIVFAGAYGIENAGDDLPLIVLCEHIKNKCPDIEFQFHVLSRHPNSWEEETYGVKMIKNIEYETRLEAKGKWFNGLNPLDDREPICRIREVIKQADLLIIGAGNALIDLTIDLFKGPIPLFALYVFLAKLYHKPVMLYGISAGPLKTELGRDLSRWIIENSDAVTVRDEDSRILLESISNLAEPIQMLPDPTIGATPKKISEPLLSLIPQQVREKPLIAVGLRNLSVVLKHEDAETASKEIANFMNYLKNEYRFLFIPQSTYKEDDDREAAKRFTDYLDQDTSYYIIKNRCDPRELISLYGLCEFTFAIRLHAAVFSAIAGTPVIAINYLPKVKGFMNEISSLDYLVEIDQIKQSLLIDLAKHIITNQVDISKRIQEKILEKKKLIYNYADTAIQLLSSCAHN